MSTATDEDLTLIDDDTDEAPKNPTGEDRGDVVVPDKAAAKDEAEKDDEQDDEPTKAAEKSAKPLMIPKDRFDEVNESAKELRRQNELLMQALAARSPGDAEQPAAQDKAAQDPVDLDKLESDYTDALLDGNTDKAKELRKLIRAEETRQAVEQALQAQAQQTERQAFTAEVQAIYADYPKLNNKAPDADEKAIAEVIEWRDFLVARRGIPLHTALRQAAERVAEGKGWTTEAEPDAQSRVNPRTEAQRRRNAQAALDQPPPLDGGVGERASRPRQMDVSKMSEDEFKALPEADKKRLRGD